MNISAFCSYDKAYVKCDHIKGIAHGNAAIWVKSALLPVICAILAQLRDYCVHFSVSNTSRRTQTAYDKLSGAACLTDSIA